MILAAFFNYWMDAGITLPVNMFVRISLYEAPFLLLRHLIKYTHICSNERLYVNTLFVPHLNPYMEIGYGIGTHIFDVGVFKQREFKYKQVGCKFTFRAVQINKYIRI